MILSALKELADREGLIVSPALEFKPLTYMIILDESGHCLNIEDTFVEVPVSKGKPKRKPKTLAVPRPFPGARRAGKTIDPGFLVDNASFVLGANISFAALKSVSDELKDKLRDIPGVEPVHSYPKAKWHGLYGGWQVIYHPEELGGLSPEKFKAALRAEGVPIRGHGWASGHLGEHLRTIFTKGYDLWGHGRGPLDTRYGFMGLPPFKPYKKGDFPITEDLAKRVVTIPPYIEPEEGLIEQFIEAFRKVAENYKELL